MIVALLALVSLGVDVVRGVENHEDAGVEAGSIAMARSLQGPLDLEQLDDRDDGNPVLAKLFTDLNCHDNQKNLRTLNQQLPNGCYPLANGHKSVIIYARGNMFYDAKCAHHGKDNEIPRHNCYVFQGHEDIRGLAFAIPSR